MEWIWNHEKNRTNKRDHGLSFETAQLVFDGLLALSRLDPHPDGNRWQSIRLVGTVVLFVVHTWPEADAVTDLETGRIISARRATTHERRSYEEGNF